MRLRNPTEDRRAFRRMLTSADLTSQPSAILTAVTSSSGTGNEPTGQKGPPLDHLWKWKHHGKTSTHAPVCAFPVSFSVTLSSQIESPPRARLHFVCSLWFSSSASCCSSFDYFVVIEIVFMDNQAQITETISRLDSEKVR